MPNIVNRIRRHLNNSESHHGRIAAGFLWVSIFVFLGKLASAGKEMAVAWRYGVSETVDAYTFAFNLITWPASIWFSVLTLVLIPLVVRIRHENPNEIPRFQAELLGVTLFVGLVLGGLIYVVFPAVLRTGWTGLGGNALQESIVMAGGLAALAPIGMVASLLSIWIMSCGKHYNTLLEGVPALVILVAVMSPSEWTPEPLLWGTVVGFVLHMIALAAPLRGAGELQMPRLRFSSPAWRDFSGSLGIMVVGQCLISSASMIDQIFAADLGPGALATLSYANRILSLIFGIVVMAITRATLPVFSQMQAQDDGRARRLALQWVKWIFLIGLLVASIAWIAAPFAVRVLFERGAFRHEETIRVTEALQYGLIQIPIYGASLVLISLMASWKKYKILLISGGVGLIVKILSLTSLTPSMQLKGILLSAAIMYSSTFILFLIVLKKKY